MCVLRKPLLKEHTEKEKEEAKMNELKIVNSKQGSCDRKWRKKTATLKKKVELCLLKVKIKYG